MNPNSPPQPDDRRKHNEKPSPETESVIPKHGGYKNLITFKLAELIYGVTVRFCNRNISIKSRTHDQMLKLE